MGSDLINLDQSSAADRFVSFAQNGEDVVLWRALSHITAGRYLDVGANDPSDGSVTRAFYDRGWSGVAVEPDPAFAERFRLERPRDVVIEAVVTDVPSTSAVLHRIEGTGLSTLVDDIRDFHQDAGFQSSDTRVPALSLDAVIEEAGLTGEDIHLLSVDTEGSEESVLRSIDLARHRPWVILVEATAPNTTKRTHDAWEPLLLEYGYEFCLFDGLSRFYVASERASLRARLDYPACVFDDYRTLAELRAEAETQRLHRAVADEAARADDEAARADRAEAELAQMQKSVYWRLTLPLRRLHRRADEER